MPGYTQTEVGVIPEEWEVKELSALLEQSRGIRYGIVQPGKYDPRGCLMLRSQDYSKGWANPDDMHRVNSLLENQYRNARIRSSDLIMTIVGAGIGQVEVAPPWLDGAILSRSTARIAIDDKQAARRFIAAFLESPIGTRQILNCQKEAAQPVVSCRDLAKFLVPYPSPPEQRAIAGALGDVDALLGALTQLIAKKRGLKQAAMQQLLTGQSRLPGFSGEWEVKRLGDVSAIKTGKKNNEDKIEDGQYPFFVRSQTVERINSYSFEGEAILVPGEGGIGSIFHYTNGRFDYHQRVYKISDFTADVCGAFVFFCMKQTFSKQATRNSVKATVDSLRLPTFREFEFLAPSVDEQAAIAAVLSDMDAELAALEQRLAKTRALKQGMMQELLTGRTRLV